MPGLVKRGGPVVIGRDDKGPTELLHREEIFEAWVDEVGGCDLGRVFLLPTAVRA